MLQMRVTSTEERTNVHHRPQIVMHALNNLYRHRTTGDLYVIRRHSDGKLVGSAGPLPGDLIIKLESVPVTAENNMWIEENAEDLILVDASGIGNRELADVAGYVFGVFEALDDCGPCGLVPEAELPRLDGAIRQLTEMLASCENDDIRLLLEAIEGAARWCRISMVRRLGTEN